ncbi:peroxisome biogenesis factor 2-like [Diadema setosum]|uniref:peroxisome biogenesis factor 2-like n=1 Tax=Diadema setosum TaxID=31175 RepID=UPI003B3B71AB
MSHSVLRVNQLDAHQLDDEIHILLRTQFTKAFQFFQPGVLSKIDPELNALLRLLIWRFSVRGTGATLGQHMLNMLYTHTLPTGQRSEVLGRKQKILFALLLIGCKWFQERSMDISQMTGSSERVQVIWKLVHWLERLVKVASLVNFLVFLQQGFYPTLLERVLGIIPRFAHPQSVRQVTFEFMTRELLWHGFAEFLFFLLPLINVHRIRNFLRRRLLGSGISRPEGRERSRSQYTECAVCGDWPTCPQEIGCQHIFCYYCLHSNYQADPSFACPSCGHPVRDASNIHPVVCGVR